MTGGQRTLNTNNMKYIAKCTWCQKDVKIIYKESASFVTDVNDVYIEVDNEDVAEVIEELNRKSRKMYDLKKKVLETIINSNNNSK